MMDADDRDEDDLTLSGSRRQSEPHRDSLVSSPSAYRQYSSTYPPPISRMSSTTTTSQMRPMYPPQTTSSSVSTSREHSYARSPTEMTHNQSYGYSFNSSHPSAPSALSSLPPAATGPAAFGPPSAGVMMTESPQPLTRDQADDVHRSGGTSYSSLSAKMHETQLQPRHPPPGPLENSLPSLPSLRESRYTGPNTNPNPPPPMQPPAILTSHPPLFAGQQNQGYGVIVGTQPAAASGPASAMSSTASASVSAPHSLNSAGPHTQPSSASSLREMYPSSSVAIPAPQPQPQSHPHPHPHPITTSHSHTHGHTHGHSTRSSASSLRDLGLASPTTISGTTITNTGGTGGGGTGDSLAVEYIRGIERREADAQAEIRRLRNEVDWLRAQLAQSQQQVGQAQQQIMGLQQAVQMGGMERR